MQRIQQIDQTSAPEQTGALLDAVKKQMGMVPNLVATLAQSPAALGGYLGLAGALGEGVLPPALREQIAIATAGVNACDYCASAHTAGGRMQGLSAEELAQNLNARSTDNKTEAALSFVARIVIMRGRLSDGDLNTIRKAGFSDEEIVEIIAHTALNIFTNYFNHIADTDIDFPRVNTAAANAA